MPSSHGKSESYRYGFNGMEKDDELKGDGNAIDYDKRFYDTRLGRFLSIDPLEKNFHGTHLINLRVTHRFKQLIWMALKSFIIH
ncbi:hypothetical protein [Flavobacterium gyeonganense]|uniref:hypothetical protein n=1 Tax=Flavobacterium gyeonganense TaxID=1310418 RepID=UPI00241463D5|nr:hypothetical protein [Flavobacterium gyeonganense]